MESAMSDEDVKSCPACLNLALAIKNMAERNLELLAEKNLLLGLNRALDEQWKQITELKDENERLREALEKYANKRNWRYKSNNDVGSFDAWLDFKPDHFCGSAEELGGFTAREALKKEVVE